MAASACLPVPACSVIGVVADSVFSLLLGQCGGSLGAFAPRSRMPRAWYSLFYAPFVIPYSLLEASSLVVISLLSPGVPYLPVQAIPVERFGLWSHCIQCYVRAATECERAFIYRNLATKSKRSFIV